MSYVRDGTRGARWERVRFVVGSLLVCASCAGIIEGGGPPPPPPATALVREPAHGQTFDGAPSALVVHVAGDYPEDGATLSIQVLGNPDDLQSWTTIGSAEVAAQTFALDVRPVASEADAARWPAGGVLRLRVIDEGGAALPFDLEEPAQNVLAVVNPGPPPASWHYLEERLVGSEAETDAYYATIQAPATLDDFIAKFGLATDLTTVRYYNLGDLGIGREMHCKATATPAGGLACYVRNYGTFGGSLQQALAALDAAGAPLATVAMVYTPPIDAPNAVAFMVYGPDNALVRSAQLDVAGNNASIPQNCLNCHGGKSRYDAATHTATNARFLPFDPSAFLYSPAAGFEPQQAAFRDINHLVTAAAPTPAVTELVDGMFPANDAPYDAAFVPAAWATKPSDARVYRQAIAPYCRSCHATGTGAFAFATPADLASSRAGTLSRICGPGPHGMPAAQQTAQRFYASSARAVLLTWLTAPGACAP
jgi:hypothetical protein